MKKNQSGFTLIELLIVIVIIGIITAVVSGSISDSRLKARDAKAKNIMSQFTSFAARYSNENNNSYVGLCTSTEANDMLNSAFSSVSVTRGATDCVSDTDEYIVAVPLLYKSGYLFCTDQTGAKTEILNTLPVEFVSGSVSCFNQ